MTCPLSAIEGGACVCVCVHVCASQAVVVTVMAVGVWIRYLTRKCAPCKRSARPGASYDETPNIRYETLAGRWRRRSVSTFRTTLERISSSKRCTASRRRGCTSWPGCQRTPRCSRRRGRRSATLHGCASRQVRGDAAPYIFARFQRFISMFSSLVLIGWRSS